MAKKQRRKRRTKAEMAAARNAQHMDHVQAHVDAIASKGEFVAEVAGTKKKSSKEFLEKLRHKIIDIRECFADSEYLEYQIITDQWFNEDDELLDQTKIPQTPEARLVRRKMLVDQLVTNRSFWSRLNELIHDIYTEEVTLK